MSYTISIYVITMSTHIFNIFNFLMNLSKIEIFIKYFSISTKQI